MCNLIRDWLTRNLVFFQTYSFLCLGTASCYFTYNSYQLNQAKTLTDKKLNSAFLVMERKQGFNNLTKKFEDDLIMISNIGKPLRSFSSDTYVFLEITKDYLPYKKLPIIYFPFTIIGNRSIGLLETKKNRQNHMKLLALVKEANSRNMNIELRIFLSASYQDAEGDKVEKCFYIKTFDSEELENRVCHNEREKFNSLVRLDIDRVKIEDIL